MTATTRPTLDPHLRTARDHQVPSRIDRGTPMALTSSGGSPPVHPPDKLSVHRDASAAMTSTYRPPSLSPVPSLSPLPAGPVATHSPFGAAASANDSTRRSGGGGGGDTSADCRSPAVEAVPIHSSPDRV